MAREVSIGEFRERIERAARALRAGKTRTLAYTLGVDVGDVARVGGTTSDGSGPVKDRPGGPAAA